MTPHETTAYLAGYMSADPSTRAWRREAAVKLAAHGVRTLDPFRGKQTLSTDGLSCSHPTSLLTARDKADILRSDVVVLYTIGMNTSEITRQSIGTWSEFGFAAIGLGKPVIIVATDDAIRRHPFIEKWAALVVSNIDEAVEAVLWLR